MGFFRNVINSVKNMYLVNSKLKPFLSDLLWKLNSIVIIPEKIDIGVIDAYRIVSTTEPDKYKDILSEYVSNISRIKEHNEVVSDIQQRVLGFDYQEILSNPYSFTKEKIESYSKFAELVNSFTHVGTTFQKFLNEFWDIEENYDDIVEQFELIPRTIPQLLDVSKYKYIDERIKNGIVGRIKKFKDTLSKYKKIYYDISDLSKYQSVINKHNQQYIVSEMNNPVFNDIDGRKLDNEQRISVITDEVSNLVVAGAGSGKTLTICGKVKYLTEVLGVQPEDILLLSYSRQSADDLQNRVDKVCKGLNVGTFHAIGLDILKTAKGKVFTVEEQYDAIIESYFRDELVKRPDMMRIVLEYYALYSSKGNSEKKYYSKGEMYEDLKKDEFETLKNLTNNYDKRETIKKEHVKSFEEMAIANWYFIHGVDYRYEYPFKVDLSTPEKRQYLPDFYLPEYKIYHEHYGVDKNGKASQFVGEEAEAYVHLMIWKRMTHEQYQTKCIETYSYQFSNRTIFDELEKQLKAQGVRFKPLSEEEVNHALASFYNGQAFKSFISLVKSFINLYKSKYRDDTHFDILAKEINGNKYEVYRGQLFLKIAKDVYRFYYQTIREKKEIDFDDMILQSMDELVNLPSYRYKYIIVDEFQDISFSRMEFLKVLIKHGNAKLFAVGDDWQSIYRFSGCDLSIFTQFENYFGKTEITKITTTHRNSQELQDIVGPFIKKNPEQINKFISSDKHLEKPIRLAYYSDNKFQVFASILKQIYNVNKHASILVLGRNNRDKESILMDTRLWEVKKKNDDDKTVLKSQWYPELNITFSTVHGSKGLEDDYVILINAEDARIGFPNKMEDDPLLNLVLSEKSNFLYAEERRLWYVALTRTKSFTYIMVNSNSPSEFVEEIKNQCLTLNPKDVCPGVEGISCPNCETGHLIKRTSSEGKEFFGCTNFPFCRYTIDDERAVKRNLRCPECGDLLVYKTGRNGPFYGCNRYPKCKYTRDYEPSKN